MKSTSDDAGWADLLDRAIRGAHPASWIFYERRQDLRIRLVGEAPPETVWTAQHGIRARPGSRQHAVYLASPRPDQIATILEETPRPVAVRPGGPLEPPWLDSQPVRDEAEHLRSMVAGNWIGRRPSFSLLWVGFRQTVWVSRPDTGVVREERRGARARLELAVPGPGAIWRRTVAETVLTPGDRPALAVLGQQACERLRRSVAARPAPSGEVEAVFAPAVAGVLVHELVGHALEADTVARGASALARTRDRVATHEVTVVDDPRRGRGGWRYDDEGTPSRPTILLERGRVRGLLHDRSTAGRSGTKSTGHGRRASFRERALPRMGCTFIKPGRLAAEEVVGATARGVYVRRMEVASTDTRSGRASFRVTDADEIEHGRIGAPLEPFVMQADAIETLSSLDLLADDLAFDRCIGSCVRDGQPVVTSVGAPTCRVGVIRALG